MYRLVYLSSAISYFSKPQLVDLLSKSRVKNATLGVTGILLYKEGDFLQLIEGERPAVEKLFATIRKDTRHGSVTILIEEECTQRLFSDWSMGFRDLSDPELLNLPGYSDFMNTPLKAKSFKDHPDDALKLVAIFAAPLRR